MTEIRCFAAIPVYICIYICIYIYICGTGILPVFF